MPRTVEEGFRDFHIKLTPGYVESAAAKSHRASIEACLKTNFAMSRFYRTGSFGNGTSISGYSDVDYFAEIPRQNLRENSDSTLRDVRVALVARFPFSGVVTNCPAVKIPFQSSKADTTEVTPADLVRHSSGGQPIYEIADCHGKWKVSSPDIHNAFVRSCDDRLGGKIKPLIRFIKAWKFYRDVPISSFYLELRVANYSLSENSIIYDIDVFRVLSVLASDNLAPFLDPMGVSGYIAACFNSFAQVDALSKLKTAVVRAQKAYEAHRKGNDREAFDYWSLLYNSNFPGYYY